MTSFKMELVNVQRRLKKICKNKTAELFAERRSIVKNVSWHSKMLEQSLNTPLPKLGLEPWSVQTRVVFNSHLDAQ